MESCIAKSCVLTQKGQPVESAPPYFRKETARRCQGCGYVFFPPPTQEELTAFYDGPYAVRNASWYTLEKDYNRTKTKLRADRVLALASSFRFDRRDTYHELGCAFGGTVLELVDRGYSATGTDINADAIEQGRQRGNIHIHAASDSDWLASKKVDVVYSFHTVEHLPDVIGALVEMRPAINGILLIWVPNILLPAALGDSFHANNWFSFPEHLHMFSPASLLCLAEAAGYDLLHVETRIGAGLANEQMQPIIPSRSTAIGQAIRAHLLNASLMGEELEFVLTPKGSRTAQVYQHLSAFQAERLDRFREAENHLMSLL